MIWVFFCGGPEGQGGKEGRKKGEKKRETHTSVVCLAGVRWIILLLVKHSHDAGLLFPYTPLLQARWRQPGPEPQDCATNSTPAGCSDRLAPLHLWLSSRSTNTGLFTTWTCCHEPAAAAGAGTKICVTVALRLVSEPRWRSLFHKSRLNVSLTTSRICVLTAADAVQSGFASKPTWLWCRIKEKQTEAVLFQGLVLVLTLQSRES